MCYLVAKNKNKHGCYALKTQHGSHLVEMKRRMNQQVASKGIQLVSITEANDEDLLKLSKRIIEKNRKVYEELDYGKTRKHKNIRRYRNIM